MVPGGDTSCPVVLVRGPEFAECSGCDLWLLTCLHGGGISFQLLEVAVGAPAAEREEAPLAVSGEPPPKPVRNWRALG